MLHRQCFGLLILVATVFAGQASLAQDAAKGRAVFAGNCSGCHSADKAADPTVALSLFGVVGRRAGSVPNYPYSAAMRTFGAVWTPEKLDAFITVPGVSIPGNEMYFDGLSSATDRADLIAYLATLK